VASDRRVAAAWLISEHGTTTSTTTARKGSKAHGGTEDRCGKETQKMACCL
jgi:hypothetical protein